MEYFNVEDVMYTISQAKERLVEEQIGYEVLSRICQDADCAATNLCSSHHGDYAWLYHEVDGYRQAYKKDRDYCQRCIESCEHLLTILPQIKNQVVLAMMHYERTGEVPIENKEFSIENYPYFEGTPTTFQFKYVANPHVNDGKVWLCISYGKDMMDRRFYTDGVSAFCLFDGDDEVYCPAEEDYIILGEYFNDFLMEVQ